MKIKYLAFLIPLCITLIPTDVYAFGKKRTTPSEPADTQAYPVRDIMMGSISKTPFVLPDGKTPVDMSVVLPDLVQGVIEKTTSKFRVHKSIPGAETRPARFAFEGGVTSFEASIFEGKIKFGYKPGVGDIGEGTLSGIEGAVKVNIGSLGVAFRIIDLERGNETVASAMANAVAPGGSLEVTIDFGAIKVGPEFVLNPEMAKVFNTAISKAVAAMAKDAQTNFLMDWTAVVSRVNRDTKRVDFNSGMRDDIQVNNVFRVYAEDDRLLGLLKVREVDHESSSAVFKDDASDKLLNSVREGDAVKIYFRKNPGRPGH